MLGRRAEVKPTSPHATNRARRRDRCRCRRRYRRNARRARFPRAPAIGPSSPRASTPTLARGAAQRACARAPRPRDVVVPRSRSPGLHGSAVSTASISGTHTTTRPTDRLAAAAAAWLLAGVDAAWLVRGHATHAALLRARSPGDSPREQVIAVSSGLHAEARRLGVSRKALFADRERRGHRGISLQRRAWSTAGGAAHRRGRPSDLGEGISRTDCGRRSAARGRPRHPSKHRGRRPAAVRSRSVSAPHATPPVSRS